MQTTSVASFQKNFSVLVAQTIKTNEPLSIHTKDGDAVLLSSEDYRGMMETIYLNSIPGMIDSIIQADLEPLSECAEYNPDEEW